MKHLVTGGAGFIGRWLVKELMANLGHEVVVLDDFSNSDPRNLSGLGDARALHVEKGSVADGPLLDRLWETYGPFDTIFHLAASIRVQDSINDPRTTFVNDVTGTFELMERARRQYFASNELPLDGDFRLEAVAGRLRRNAPRVVFMSTCMVYRRATGQAKMGEDHPTNPSSPYSASKISAENLVLSYHLTYGMAAKVLRCFNTYGPFQKQNLEGGVV
jgi:nucleoside-diphosphate-sugar epimerase